MSRVLEVLGYHSTLSGQDLDDVIAIVLLPFASLAMVVAVGLNLAFT